MIKRKEKDYVFYYSTTKFGLLNKWISFCVQEHTVQRDSPVDGGNAALFWNHTQVKSSVGKLQRQVLMRGYRYLLHTCTVMAGDYDWLSLKTFLFCTTSLSLIFRKTWPFIEILLPSFRTSCSASHLVQGWRPTRQILWTSKVWNIPQWTKSFLAYLQVSTC